MGPSGEKLAGVLNGFALNNPSDIDELFNAWLAYLNTALTFPFMGVYHTDDEYTSAVPDEGIVSVQRLIEIDPIFGLIAEVEHKSKKQITPIIYIEVQETESSNYEHLELYKLWLSNIYTEAEDEDELYEAWEEIELQDGEIGESPLHHNGKQ